MISRLLRRNPIQLTTCSISEEAGGRAEGELSSFPELIESS